MLHWRIKLREYVPLMAPLVVLHSLILVAQNYRGLEKYATYGDGAEYVNLAKTLFSDPLHVILNLHPPAYPFAIRVFAIFSSYELASLLVNAIAHIVLIIPIYEAAKLTGVSYQKRLAVMCTLFPPAMFTYAGIGLSDSLAVLFSSLFFCFLLRRSEVGMIASGLLATVTHQITYLLVVPLVCFYVKEKRWSSIYRALIPLVPVALFSLYRLDLGQGLWYYTDVHFVFARAYWDSPLFSLPFESLIGAILGKAIHAGNIEYPASPITGVAVMFLFAIYFGGIALSLKNRQVSVLSYGLPFIVFLMFYQIWFFVPRFLAYCFPLMISYGYLMERNRIVLALALLLSIASVGQSLYFLLIAFPV